ncbi:hypothetical protein SKAU_G00177300 [Synaphobranchus kaupii]|uniref:Uncharacterized protein n=1 Tax=Synaphobranchus kaupii TaxID=118154 RepID=A0A9Q1FM63_SYNKA|nr:hypothetical protein SKAU_G00177300 [Synaphobranchus kaupii]
MNNTTAICWRHNGRRQIQSCMISNQATGTQSGVHPRHAKALRGKRGPEAWLLQLEDYSGRSWEAGRSARGGSFRRRVARTGTSEAPLLNETKEEALDPPGINATIQVDIEAAEMQRIPGSNVVPRAQRRRSRRVSVMSQTTRHKKVSHRKKRKTFTFLRRKKQVERRRKPSALTIVKLQTQMDGLVETMADCSVKLLAKRQAELEHCERMGDRVADASRHFQRSTSKGSRRRRWRNACVLCSCCC